jgi:hypothetical protein
MSTILKALAVTAELTGTEWSKEACRMIADRLMGYPEPAVLESLARCQGEIKYRLTLADILDRLPGQHPGVEEAWGMVTRVMNNEQLSICWTDDMREAYGAAAPLADDKVAARQAFKEKYSTLIAQRRAMGTPPTWCVSLGFDKSLRDEAVKEATAKNLISQQYAAKLLAHDPPRDEAQKLLENLPK